MRTVFQETSPALVELGAPSHHVVFPNGTMALTAAIEAVAGPGERVAVPGLACWSLTTAVLGAGCLPTYRDICQHLVPATRASGPRIYVSPWAGGGQWAPDSGPDVILDVSVNICALPHLGEAAAGILSLGYGKPGYRRGGGGVLFTSRPDVREEVDRAVGHFIADFRWERSGARLTPLEVSADSVSSHLTGLFEGQAVGEERARGLTELLGAVCGLRPVFADPRGVFTFLPVLLPEDYPLTAVEVARVTAAHNLPLGVLPIAPAYREPAMRRRGSGCDARCPTAERTYRRLLFVPSSVRLTEGGARRISSALSRLATEPEPFRYPYREITEGTDLPGSLRTRHGPGIIGRRLDGSLVRIDQRTGERTRLRCGVADG